MTSNRMIRQRVRIRFRKEGDIRLISHIDLIRTFERLFRRAGVKLRLSEGFHPHVKMTFPSALALGIRGLDEVMEVELAEELTPESLAERLRATAPPGLEITDVRLLAPNEPKGQIQRVTYEFPVPSDRRERVASAIAALLASPAHLVRRDDKEIDVRADLDSLELSDTVVRYRLRVGPQGGVRPREVLEVLGLADLENEGCFLTRTVVELKVVELKS